MVKNERWKQRWEGDMRLAGWGDVLALVAAGTRQVVGCTLCFAEVNLAAGADGL